jgi:capsular polysaccharide biosynthesis protein
MNILLSLFSGVLLGIGLSFFMEYIDVSIKSIEHLRQLTQIPIVGNIPHSKALEWERI